MGRTMVVVLLLILHVFIHTSAHEDFDVRQHLSTVTRYGVAKDVANSFLSFSPSNVPDGCSPIHLNLVARHGTRTPTEKRIRELNNLADRLEVLLKDAKDVTVPAWMSGWKSPWNEKVKGGELISKGEEELYDLGIRIRERFPDLFDEDYHPDVYSIRATEVPRVSASAVAFGMGLLSGRGSLGPGRHRAFAVNESRANDKCASDKCASDICASDILLRFFDWCQNYKDFKKSQKHVVEKLKEPILDEITSALVGRYKLNFMRNDTSSLWFLCKQEASLLDITDRACDLFKPHEIALLEWTDDLEVFILKGYGNSVNYRMGVPLLEDVVQSMELAIEAKKKQLAPGSYEKARLRFAHAETVIPFSCLLGLFLEGSEFVPFPPKPPEKRNWRGSMVAPFAGNNMLVLYSCPANASSKYFVHVLHNEHPIQLPGCDNSDFCPFEVFKERIVAPHLKHDYSTTCNVKLEQPVHKPVTSMGAFGTWEWNLIDGKPLSQGNGNEQLPNPCLCLAGWE